MWNPTQGRNPHTALTGERGRGWAWDKLIVHYFLSGRHVVDLLRTGTSSMLHRAPEREQDTCFFGLTLAPRRSATQEVARGLWWEPQTRCFVPERALLYNFLYKILTNVSLHLFCARIGIGRTCFLIQIAAWWVNDWVLSIYHWSSNQVTHLFGFDSTGHYKR